MTCKRGRHCSVHLFWFQWKFVIFPLFAGLFSLSLCLSLCWDLVDFKLGGLILSSLLASCILGFHQRSCLHDMFANIALRNSVHYIEYHFDFYISFTIFLTGLAWIDWVKWVFVVSLFLVAILLLSNTDWWVDENTLPWRGQRDDEVTPWWRTSHQRRGKEGHSVVPASNLGSYETSKADRWRPIKAP